MDVVQQVGHVGVTIMQVRLQHTYTLLTFQTFCKPLEAY